MVFKGSDIVFPDYEHSSGMLTKPRKIRNEPKHVKYAIQII